MRIIPFPIVLHIAIALAATVAHAGLEVSYPYPDETYTACGVMPGQQISPWPTNATYSYNKWEYPYYQNMWSGVGTTFPWGKVYGSAGGPADYYISGWKYTEEGGTSAGSSGNVTGGFSMNASTDPGEYTVTYTRKDASVRPWKIVAQPNIGNGPDYNTYQETFSFSLYHAEFKSLSTSEKTVILFNGSASFDAADALSPRCYIPSNDITYSVSRSEDATVDTYGDVTFTKDGSFDVGVYHGNYSSAPANITITVVPELSNATVSSGNWSASANRSGNSSVTMFDLRDSSGCLSLTLDLDANANSGTFASGNPTWTMTGQASGNTSGNSSSFNLTAAGNYTVKVKSHSGDESNSSDEIKLDVELFGVDWTSWISDGSAYTPGNVTSTSSSDNLYVFYPHSASPGETKNKTVSMTLNASHGTTTKHGEFKYEAYKGSTSQGSPSYFSSGDGSGSVDLSYETSNSSSTDYVIKITDSLGLDFGNPDVSIAPVDWTVWASDGYIAYTPSSVNSTSTNRTLYVLVETTGNASDTMNVTIDLTLNATAGGTNYADLFKYTVTGTNAPSGADLPSSGSANFTLQYSGNLASASNYTVEFVAINGSASYGNMTVALLPIEIEKVWSDQLPGVEVNFFQKTATPKNGTGRADKPYILMGARDDGKAYVKARLGSDIPSSFDNLLLWRLAVKNGEPKPGSFTFDHSKKEVSITADSLVAEGDYQIVVGYDANKDGQLSESEINVRSEWTFKVISRSRYNTAVTSIRDAAAQAIVATPNASRLLTAFADHTTPQEATAPTTTIARSDPAGLTHNVGILFTPRANPGNSIEANFAGNSFMAITAAQTVSINNWLSDAFESKRQEVLQTFQNLDPSILVYTFDWEFTGTLNFGSYPNSSKDLDMFLAIGKVKFTIRAEVPVHRSGYIDIETGVRLYGVITDLYDFDYDEGTWVIKDAARVQSGYNKTGDGGRVYRTKINFSDTPCPVTFNFY